ncbi:MAG: hypothetical protein ACYCW5_02135 [Thermoleophilia bacterium]
MKAMDAEGAAIGSRSSSLDMSKQGWQRSGGFIFELPPGTDSYTVEILANGFVGTCHLDAFLSEPKPFFTPYFDGDSDNCMWVDAATPQNVNAGGNQLSSGLLRRGAGLSFLVMGVC